MNSLSQHISALLLLAFTAMIVDVIGIYEAVAHEDATASTVMGCHDASPPIDWEHEEPCTSSSVVPCNFCAILITLVVESSAEEFQAWNNSRPPYFTDNIAELDPDPPKTPLL